MRIILWRSKRRKEPWDRSLKVVQGGHVVGGHSRGGRSMSIDTGGCSKHRVGVPNPVPRPRKNLQDRVGTFIIDEEYTR